jgi:hypothetical protein
MTHDDASAPLRALRLIDSGDWEGAHDVVQDDPSPDAAWVHAHLHRIEGDFSNAGYWYRQAGKPVARGDLADERRAMMAALNGD